MGLDTPPTDSIRFNPAMQPFEIEPAQEGASDSPLDSQLLHLARTTGMLRAQLRAAQYPVSLYEQPIRLYERESIQMLLAGTPETANNRIKALVAGIDQARQRQRPDLPVVRYGLFSAMINPVPTIFRSSRPGGRVWIITQLRFEVCRAQFSNPFDLARCTKWRETDPQNPLSLSGTYIYQVNWNPGGNARGMRTVERGNAPPPVIYRVP